MLFFIDISLIENIGTRTDILIALENVAHTRREGKHLIFAERNTLKMLKNCNLLSSITRDVYSNIYNKISTEKSYFDKISWFAYIDYQSDNLSLDDFLGKKRLKIPARYLENFSLLNETILLAENQDDIRFYQIITNAYIHWMKLGNVIIRYEPRGGGGNTTAKEYKVLQDSNSKLCICLLDSDYKYLGAELGDTAKAVKKIDNIDQPLCQILLLNVREIENLIPTGIYQEISNRYIGRSSALETLIKIENSLSKDARYFLDLKKGFKIYDYLIMNSNTPIYDYWNKVLIDTDIDIVCDNMCIKRENCSCIIFNGFGNNILINIIDLLKENNISYIVSLLDDETKTKWQNIADMIFSWCCGSNKLIVT